LYPNQPEEKSVGYKTVLAAELTRIREWRRNRRVPDMADPLNPEQPLADADKMDLIGLALSGGGIRSATFNLGVLQAMAKLRILRRVDYLSTVSGGGYIGGWLSAMIHRTGIDAVETGLDPDQAKANALPQKAIAYLRAYSNYLTPKVSALSADTWSLWSIWSRNTLLNLAVLVSGTAALILLTQVMGVATIEEGSRGAALGWGLWLVYFFLAVSAFFLSRNIAGKSSPRWRNDKWVQILVVCPALAAAFFINGELYGHPAPEVFWRGFFLSLLFLGLQLQAGFWQCFLKQHQMRGARLWNVLLQAGVACASGYAAAWMFNGLAALLNIWFPEQFSPWLFLTAGPPAILMVLALSVILNVGLMGRDLPDEIREWLGRLGAWVTIYMLGWLLTFGASYFGPGLLKFGWTWGRHTITGTWLAATLASLLAAKSAKANGTAGDQLDGSSSALNLVAAIGPYVFMTGFVLFIGLAVHELAARGAPHRAANLTEYWQQLHARQLPQLLQLTGLSTAMCLLLSWRVDINEFSLHHFYKNRLVRCYLGASREQAARHPNPFTQFDPADDLPLNDLDSATFSGPLPILNATLNLSSGRKLAWQERKGGSFIFTPVYCGYDTGRGDSGTSASRQMRVAGDAGDNGYWPARFTAKTKGGGIHLGTSVAISGAAANPNQGYHTSPAVAFLMTVFNVRLGWWLGNPARSKADWSGPAFGLPYTLSELFGSTNADSDFVNLSDGGHFDNMALYELIRRHCRYVILCDAEQDETLSFGGLSNAIRMCRTDFGVEIDIDLSGIARQPKTEGFSGFNNAIGTIHYQGAPDGTLVYLKASLTGHEPADVLGYHSRVPQFPHESTADQWFDETQFESYRRLGMYIAEKAADAFKKGTGAFFPPK